jgi:hypothetical protein
MQVQGHKLGATVVKALRNGHVLERVRVEEELGSFQRVIGETKERMMAELKRDHDGGYTFVNYDKPTPESSHTLLPKEQALAMIIGDGRKN